MTRGNLSKDNGTALSLMKHRILTVCVCRTEALINAFIRGCACLSYYDVWDLCWKHDVNIRLCFLAFLSVGKLTCSNLWWILQFSLQVKDVLTHAQSSRKGNSRKLILFLRMWWGLKKSLRWVTKHFLLLKKSKTALKKSLESYLMMI